MISKEKYKGHMFKFIVKTILFTNLLSPHLFYTQKMGLTRQMSVKCLTIN